MTYGKKGKEFLESPSLPAIPFPQLQNFPAEQRQGMDFLHLTGTVRHFYFL